MGSNNKNRLGQHNLSQDEDWLLSRKAFVRLIALSGVAIQIPWLNSCSSEAKREIDISPLSAIQHATVFEIQKILFPDDGNGPGAEQINADGYLTWVLRDERLDPREGSYIITRIDKFNEVCEEKHKHPFQELSANDQIQFVTDISKTKWGDKWLSRLLTLIFEALLLHPSYGGNINEAGWEWLNHDPGSPRPTQDQLYPTILRNHEI